MPDTPDADELAAQEHLKEAANLKLAGLDDKSALAAAKQHQDLSKTYKAPSA